MVPGKARKDQVSKKDKYGVGRGITVENDPIQRISPLQSLFSNSLNRFFYKGHQVFDYKSQAITAINLFIAMLPVRHLSHYHLIKLIQLQDAAVPEPGADLLQSNG